MITILRKLVPNNFPLRVWYLKMWTLLGAIKYRFPARGVPIIGITGTDGKTTTSFFTMQLLRALGNKVGMATTVGFQIGDEYRRNSTHKTSMGRFGLMKLFREFQDNAIDIAVVEVSSHGLVQGRLDHVDFSTAVITNLSREHLDYHKTMEGYRNAKMKLFTQTRKHKGTRSFVVYSDFPEAKAFMNASTKGKLLTFGGSDLSDIMLKSVQHTAGGMHITFEYDDKSYAVDLACFGEFNVWNLFAAMAVCIHQGYTMEEICKCVPILKGPPGRMEQLKTKKGVTVYIDYAVTPKALTELYTTLQNAHTGRVIALLGACGDRDQGKRPEMGEIATRICDHVIFTNEEPYTEEPRSIIAMLVSGAKEQGRGNYDIVEDRAAAIERALHIADKGDVVVISGMGDQDSMVVGDQMFPWNDREEVEKRMGIA